MSKLATRLRTGAISAKFCAAASTAVVLSPSPLHQNLSPRNFCQRRLVCASGVQRVSLAAPSSIAQSHVSPIDPESSEYGFSASRHRFWADAPRSYFVGKLIDIQSRSDIDDFGRNRRSDRGRKKAAVNFYPRLRPLINDPRVLHAAVKQCRTARRAGSAYADHDREAHLRQLARPDPCSHQQSHDVQVSPFFLSQLLNSRFTSI